MVEFGMIDKDGDRKVSVMCHYCCTSRPTDWLVGRMPLVYILRAFVGPTAVSCRVCGIATTPVSYTESSEEIRVEFDKNRQVYA